MHYLKFTLTIALAIGCKQMFGQIDEKFNDADFDHAPVWTGDVTKFSANTQQLKLAAPAVAGSAYLSTSSTAIYQGSWEFEVSMAFNPSSTNYALVYLTASHDVLTNNPDGYIVRVGNTGDDVSFYRQIDGVLTELIKGRDGLLNLAAPAVRIKVTVSASGQWELFTDLGLTGNYQSEGTAVDLTLQSSLFFGVQCIYTATRSDKFTFDNITVTGSPFPDITPPALLSHSVTSDHTIELQFTEPLDSASVLDSAHYSFESTLSKVDSVIFVTSENRIILHTSALQNWYTYYFSVAGIRDKAGNKADTIRLPIRWFQPVPVKYHDIILSEFLADPDPSVGMPAAEYVELMNNSREPFELNNWTITDGNSRGKVPAFMLLPGQFAVLTHSGNTEQFSGINPVLGVTNFPSLNNKGDFIALMDSSSTVVDSLHFNISWYKDPDKAQGGWSLERNSDPGHTLWTASINTHGGTPGEINSVWNLNSDQKPPILLSDSLLNPTTYELHFSEAMDSASTLHRWNYKINKQPFRPDTITLVNPSTIRLTFSRPLQNGLTYQMTIDSLQDVAGNPVTGLSLSFGYYIPIAYKKSDLVVNELLADPEPVVGLPPAEFVEIFNRSKDSLWLRNWSITDGSSIGILPDQWLSPGAYALITSSSSSSIFNSSIVLPVTNFPTLNNSGDLLVIRDALGTVIDSLHYSASWYGDPDKAQGGWSLERTQPDSISTASRFWSASMNASGGTPGQPNSVLGQSSDRTPPILVSAQVEDSKHLIASFSEAVSSGDARVQLGDTTILIDSLLLEAPNICRIILSSPLSNGKEYELQISGFADHAGNAMTLKTLTISYFSPQPYSSQQVVVNEIFADPEPQVGLPAVEYIELFNRSNQTVDLAHWTLSDGSSHAILPAVSLNPGMYVILSPVSSSFPTGTSVLVIPGFPTLNNPGDQIVLKDAMNNIVDSLVYKSTWYRDSDKAQGGWSLERISCDSISGDPSNWRASYDSTGGTPGQINSLPPPEHDTKAPQVLALAVIDSLHVEITFSEELDTLAAKKNSWYLMMPDEHLPSAIDCPSPNKVRLTWGVPMENGKEYVLSVKDVPDLSGNKLEPINLPATYLTIKHYHYQDVVINEFLADPEPSVGLPPAEYIELFNRSPHTVDLVRWTLSDGNTTAYISSTMLSPGGFLILTAAGNETLFSSGAIGLRNFPTLNNSGDQIILHDASGTTIDSLKYDDNWYDDPDKRQGGWSLERKFADSLSTIETNWKASSDSTGGTAGRHNSLPSKVIDTTAPTITAVNVTDSLHVNVTFSEALDTLESKQVAFNHLTLDGIRPQAVDFLSQASLRLTWSAPMENGVEYRLVLKALTDLSGNSLEEATFPVTHFSLITYEKGDVVFNELLADPEPSVGLPPVEYVELFNRSTRLVDLARWSLSDGNTKASVPAVKLKPGSYLILTSAGTEQHFSSGSVGLKNFPTLNNSGDHIMLYDGSGKTIDSLAYSSSWYDDPDKSQGGWSLERQFADNLSTERNNWRASTDSLGGTPGSPNSKPLPEKDHIAPEWLTLEVVDRHRLELVLSETLDSTQLLSRHFRNSKGQQPDSVLRRTPTQIQLYFDSPFSNGDTDELWLDSLADQAGNQIALSHRPFMFYEPTRGIKGRIVINELLPDPEPSVGLPKGEYIELLNISDSTQEIIGWKITDGSSLGIIPSIVLAPDSLIVLTSTKNIDLFRGIRAIGVKDFPTLNNSRDRIVLTDGLNQVMDSVSYDQSWYADDDKKEGGWSLERSATTLIRWYASTNQYGGTPGQVNSNEPLMVDQTPPELIQVSITSLQSVAVVFSEMIDSTSLASSKFDLNLSIHPQRTEWAKDTIKLVFDSPFENGAVYTLHWHSIADTRGNVSSGSSTFRYFVPQNVNPKDIKITEIMADPSPSVGLPETEFIELYNRSNNPVHLLGWTLSNGRRSATLTDSYLLPKHWLTIVPAQFSGSLGVSEVLRVNSFPALSNDGDDVILKDSRGLTIDSLHFDLSWYHSSLQQDGGWCLEIVDVNNDCGEANNWAASSDYSGGTPGRVSSVAAENPDLTPPALISAFPASDSTLILGFSETMARLTASDLFGTVEVVPTGVQIELSEARFINNTLTQLEVRTSLHMPGGVTMRLHIDGVHDCAGNAYVSNSSIEPQFGLPEPADSLDLVINEVLFNPRSTGVDFVEVYNTSNRFIDLQGMSLANMAEVPFDLHPIAGDHLLLPPHSFIAFTPEPLLVRNEYPESSLQNMWAMSLPSLPDDAGSIALVAGNGKVLDAFHYDRAYHSPFIASEQGVSLERISADAPTEDAANWRSGAGYTGFATPGYRNANEAGSSGATTAVYVSPDVIVPHGTPDFARIDYHLDRGGYLSNIKVLDTEGRLIKTLAQNESLATEGFFRWDGDRDDGGYARMGYYIVWFQLFDAEGHVEVHRKRVVVAR